jgi:hypothetical protein
MAALDVPGGVGVSGVPRSSSRPSGLVALGLAASAVVLNFDIWFMRVGAMPGIISPVMALHLMAVML